MECPICADDIEDSNMLSCGHNIHMKCVANSGKSVCPMCRIDIVILEEHIEHQNLDDAIRVYSQKERPLLGVCLGMQMLLSRGFEHKETQGLGIIDGDVLPLPKDMPNFKIPNINWHEITEPNQGRWINSILQNTKNDTCFYFVHSYYASPRNANNVLANSLFGTLNFASAIQKEHVFGTQFHPEKSGEDGLNLLNKFLDF